jgi:hypothetical protein
VAYTRLSYNHRVNWIDGIYKKGKITLVQPVDWPDGLMVRAAENPPRPGDLPNDRDDVCVDGSMWDDSKEAVQQWLDWFDSLGPMLQGEELEQFERTLSSTRKEQSPFVAEWHKRIDGLVQ